MNMVDCVTCLTSISDSVAPQSPDAIILSGSSLNLSEPMSIESMRKSVSVMLRHPRVPTLGICFGMQLLCSLYGGKLARLQTPNRRIARIRVDEGSALLDGAAREMSVTLSHGDCVVEAPSDFAVYSRLDDGCIQLVESLEHLRFGVQFHPERLPDGETTCVLTNFLRFVAERASVPAHLGIIGEEARVRLLRDVAQRRRPWRAMEEEYRLPRDDMLLLWRLHLRAWNLPAVLL